MAGFGALAYDPMTGLAITPEEVDAPAVVRPQGAPVAAIERDHPATPYHALLDKPSEAMPVSAYHALLDQVK